jgi:hypothetical protein
MGIAPNFAWGKVVMDFGKDSAKLKTQVEQRA